MTNYGPISNSSIPYTTSSTPKTCISASTDSRILNTIWKYDTQYSPHHNFYLFLTNASAIRLKFLDIQTKVPTLHQYQDDTSETNFFEIYTDNDPTSLNPKNINYYFQWIDSNNRQIDGCEFTDEQITRAQFLNNCVQIMDHKKRILQIFTLRLAEIKTILSVDDNMLKIIEEWQQLKEASMLRDTNIPVIPEDVTAIAGDNLHTSAGIIWPTLARTTDDNTGIACNYPSVPYHHISNIHHASSLSRSSSIVSDKEV